MSKWTAAHRQGLIIRLRKRDGLRCWLCGGLFSKQRPITIDHAIPKARGGTNVLANLRLAHAQCNNERGCIASTGPRPAATRLRNIRLAPVFETVGET